MKSILELVKLNLIYGQAKKKDKSWITYQLKLCTLFCEKVQGKMWEYLSFWFTAIQAKVVLFLQYYVIYQAKDGTNFIKVHIIKYNMFYIKN